MITILTIVLIGANAFAWYAIYQRQKNKNKWERKNKTWED